MAERMSQVDFNRLYTDPETAPYKLASEAARARDAESAAAKRIAELEADNARLVRELKQIEHHKIIAGWYATAPFEQIEQVAEFMNALRAQEKTDE